MKKVLKQAGKLLMFLFPLVLGMAGLWAAAGEPVQDALFSCVNMYVLNYGDTPPNLMVELARWLAPLSTASGILMVLSGMKDRLCAWLRYLTGEGVVVYGPEAERSQVVEQLGKRGIQGTDDLLPARRYILLGDSDTSFALCRRILRRQAEADVFLQCAQVRPQLAVSPRLHLFSPEETAARLFWTQRCLYPCSVKHGHKLKIIFIGFGPLGEHLLYYGLLDNIFHPGQTIEYHIFNGDLRFAAVHTQLESISDPVEFHEQPWWEALDFIDGAQLVLLLPQEGQAGIAQDLLLAVHNSVVAFGGDPALELLAQSDRLEIFSWMDMALEPECILQDTLLARAKKINLRYAHIYGNVEENAQNSQAEWDKLDSFTRYSNISCADYHDVRLNMLGAMGYPAAADQLPPEIMELLAELEHIRWCRYHYLDNWRFGMPENGKRKDMLARVHMDLIPYGDLDEDGKDKDRENIRVLLSI